MQKQPQLSPDKYIISKAALLPFHECYINEDWKSGGLATIVISKKMPSGKLIFGMYLIDIFCLGLKNTLYKFACTIAEYSEFLAKENQVMIKCDLTFAHNLIYGAIDYAEEIGFSPNKTFKITEHLLDSDLIDDGIDTMEFGVNGKPMFVAGPYDDTNRIIGILERSVGAGNYEFISSLQ